MCFIIKALTSAANDCSLSAIDYSSKVPDLSRSPAANSSSSVVASLLFLPLVYFLYAS